MKEVIIIIVIFFMLARLVGYNGSRIEEEVRVFCESIQSDKLSYEEIIALARNNKMEIKVYGNDQVDGSKKDTTIMTEIRKRLWTAHFSCYVEQNNEQIINVKFVANWDN